MNALRLSYAGRIKAFQASLPRDLPASYKLIAIALFTFADADGGSIFASVRTIMQQSGESERTVKRALAYFTEAGWLVKDGERHTESGAILPMRRLVTEALAAQRQAEIDQCEEGETPDIFGTQGDNTGMGGVTTQVRGGDNTGKNADPTPYITRSTSRSTSKKGHSYSAEFESWWRHYPNKVDKEPASRAFKTAIGKINLEVLIEATKAYAARVTDPAYQKMPQGWLNGERWKQEAAIVRNQVAGAQQPPKSFDRVNGAL